MKFSRKGMEEYLNNPGREMEGIYLKFGPVEIKVRRAGGANTAYETAMAKYVRPYRKKVLKGSMTPEDMRNKVLIPTYLDAVVIDWRGVEDDKGENVPYSRQMFMDYITEFPEVFDELITLTTEASLFLEQQVEETADDVGKP